MDNEIKEDIGLWTSHNTDIIKMKDGTYEIATVEIDSYGDTVYCFVEETDNGYIISDDGRLLFKFDPAQTNEEFLETAKDIVIGAGFDFDDKSSEISVITDRENLAQAIMRLAQLQVAISFMI